MTRLLKPLSGVVGAGFKYDVRSTDMSLKATNDYTTVDLSGAVNVLKINNQSGMVKQIPVKATSYSISFKVADLGDLTPGNYTLELWSQKNGVTTVYPDTSASVTNITIGSMHLDGLDSPVATVFIKSFENATPEYIEDTRAKMDAYNVHAEMRNNAIYVNGFMVLDLNPQSPSSDTGGSAGVKGDTGDSAYDLWLKQGHSGTLQDYLNWTKGEQGIQGTPGRDGESAYETWIRNGHRGSEQDFLNSLRGPQGEHGEALTIKATSDSFQSGKTYGELVITGPNKRTMRDFSRGMTILVFDMDLNLQAQKTFDTYGNYPGDVTNAANYLKGLAKSIVVVIEANAAGLNKDLVDQLVKMGATNDLYGLPMVANRRVLSFIGMSADYGLKPGQGYLAVTNGSDAQSATVFAQVGGQGIAINGANGESAYEIWKRNGHQNDSEATFLNSLRGSKGDKGDKGNQGDKGDKGDPGAEGSPGRDGESAYETWIRNGHRGSEQDFLNSLRGPQGEHGEALTIKATSDSFQSGKTYGELVITGPNKRTMRDFSRGMTILVFDMDLNLQAQKTFDTYGNYPGDVTNAANYLKGLAKSIVVVIEANAAGLNKDLVDQLVKMGATNDLYGLPMVANRRVLSFIGMSADYGLKPGQGYLAVTNGSDAQSATVFAQVGGQGIAINGANGESAYEIWKRNGHQNDSEATFLNSLRGSKGDKGDKGNQGDKGDKGDPGAEGSPGRDGEGTMYWQWVDLTASKFDQNKWYPVVKNGGIPATKFNVFAASHELDPGEFKPSWATHKNGFTVSCRYLANYPAWGAIPTNGIIEAEEGFFVSDDTCPVHFDIHAQNGGYVFYLRGGARYQLGDNLRNMTWQVYDGTYSANGLSFDPLDKEPVSFKRIYNDWSARHKIIDLPALAELGGVSDVNLLPQITPQLHEASGSRDTSIAHGSAQRFNSYEAWVEILPVQDIKQRFLKGDDIRQSAIIRTDGRLNGVCFSFFTDEDGHRFMPCIIRDLGNNNYLITCKWRADKDVNVRCIDITKMDISGHTYVEIDKPFIGISQVGG